MKCDEMCWNVMKCYEMYGNIRKQIKAHVVFCLGGNLQQQQQQQRRSSNSYSGKEEKWGVWWFLFFWCKDKKKHAISIGKKIQKKKHKKQKKNKKKISNLFKQQMSGGSSPPPVSGGSERAVEASKGSDEDGDQWALRSNIKHSTTNIDEQLSKRTTAAIEQLKLNFVFFFFTKPSIDLPRKIPFHSIPIEHTNQIF